jgi:hypothetical protein
MNLLVTITNGQGLVQSKMLATRNFSQNRHPAIAKYLTQTESQYISKAGLFR